MGITVSSDNDQLLTGAGTAASPWVIAVEQAGIAGLPSVINVVVLISAFVSFFLLEIECNADTILSASLVCWKFRSIRCFPNPIRSRL